MRTHTRLPPKGVASQDTARFTASARDGAGLENRCCSCARRSDRRMAL